MILFRFRKFFFCIGFTLISFRSVSTDDGIYLLRLDARQHLYKVSGL